MNLKGSKTEKNLKLDCILRVSPRPTADTCISPREADVEGAERCVGRVPLDRGRRNLGMPMDIWSISRQ